VTGFILDHSILVWRWSTSLLAATIIVTAFFAYRALKRPHSSDGIRWKRLVVALAGLLLAGCVILMGLRLGPFVETVGHFERWKGSRVPDIVLTRVSDGKPLTTASLRGRVVVLNLWATWCPPCRTEMPDLVRLEREHGGELAVVTVSDESAQQQQKFGARYALPSDACTGDLGWNTGTFRPFSLIIDREGRVRDVIVGARDYTFFEHRVRDLL
jgi:thiol-disulfide isomerase/thioredoxin